ncbi:MAG: lysophospholipid acyltransferase family protein [Acidobacteria bacterium]|nr:lysophospholipid acyltransferase family protein [Acidobacteriota bacterium]
MKPGPIREFVEYAAAWTALSALGLLPRRAAVTLGEWVGESGYRLARGLARTGRRNLEIAFPEKPLAERERILRGAFRNVGRQLGEFSQIPRLRTPEDARRTVRLENREIPLDVLASGRGVLFLTGHFGAWEISPICMRISGTPPVNFLVRRLDNPRLEALAERLRTRCGNRTIDKARAARPVLAALGRGEMVGILADLNTLDNEGVFVDFFGIPASTTGGLATFALKTNAAVIPVHTRWDEGERRYVQKFEPELEILRTGSRDEDIRANTQNFTSIVEGWIRANPDQWIWIHRRWKTRPPGEPGLY